jgi:hypothetical protein
MEDLHPIVKEQIARREQAQRDAISSVNLWVQERAPLHFLAQIAVDMLRSVRLSLRGVTKYGRHQ